MENAELRRYGRSISALSESIAAGAAREAASKGEDEANARLVLWLMDICVGIANNYRKYHEQARAPEDGSLFLLGSAQALSRPNCARLEVLADEHDGPPVFALPAEVCARLYDPQLLTAALSDWLYRGCEGREELARAMMSALVSQFQGQDPDSLGVLYAMMAEAVDQNLLQTRSY